MSNTELIQREYDARKKAEMDARAILDTAAEEKRSTTPEEDERFDRFVAESDSRKARIVKLQKLDADNAELAEAVRNRVGEQADDDSGKGNPAKGQSTDRFLIETVRSMAAIYKNGGDLPAETGRDVAFNLEEIRAISDFATGTSLYVSDFSSRVAVFQRTMSPWINLGEVINADNARPLILPNTSVDPTTYTPGEGTAITASDPTLGTATATPKSYKDLTLVSQEADEDELIGLLGIIAKTQGRSLGLAFGTDATAAVLSGGTNGGTANGTGGSGTATVAFFGYEDLLDLKFGIASPYRVGGTGKWIMANGAIKKVRKFKDQQGAYFYTAASNPQSSDMFDGDPIYEDPGLAAPASATKSVVYGDPSAFVIKQMALRVAVSSDYLFNLDQLAIKSVWRVAGALADAAALRYLVSANS